MSFTQMRFFLKVTNYADETWPNKRAAASLSLHYYIRTIV